MSLDDARLILNTARAGGAIPMYLITEALGVTGDLSTTLKKQISTTVASREWPYYATADGQAA